MTVIDRTAPITEEELRTMPYISDFVRAGSDFGDYRSKVEVDRALRLCSAAAVKVKENYAQETRYMDAKAATEHLMRGTLQMPYTVVLELMSEVACMGLQLRGMLPDRADGDEREVPSGVMQ